MHLTRRNIDESDGVERHGLALFLPAPGWESIQTDATSTSSNIGLGPLTPSGNVPWDTVEQLQVGDVVRYVFSTPMGENPAVDAAFPPRELPPSIDDAEPASLEGKPDDVYDEAWQVQADGWNITIHTFYGGSAQPSAEARALAQEQLDRLDVPAR